MTLAKELLEVLEEGYLFEKVDQKAAMDLIKDIVSMYNSGMSRKRNAFTLYKNYIWPPYNSIAQYNKICVCAC